MKEKQFVFNFILHPSAFILSLFPPRGLYSSPSDKTPPRTAPSEARKLTSLDSRPRSPNALNKGTSRRRLHHAQLDTQDFFQRTSRHPGRARARRHTRGGLQARGRLPDHHRPLLRRLDRQQQPAAVCRTLRLDQNQLASLLGRRPRRNPTEDVLPRWPRRHGHL